MTLANLLAIQRLLAFSATPRGVQRLLTAAARNLADAKITQLSPENRFDAAYKCIMQCAMIGLWAHGYRTSTSPATIKRHCRRCRSPWGCLTASSSFWTLYASSAT